MRSLWDRRSIWAGVVGALAGGLAQGLINSLAGRVLVREGMIWGAVVAISVVSLSNFTRMGELTIKSNRPVVNFAAGLVMFALISALVVALFFGLFIVLGRLLS